MIELEQTDDGVLLPVKAQPGARKNGVAGVHAGSLKVAVTQAAEKGKANDALIKVLAEALQVRRAQIGLVRGASNPRKVFLIEGVPLDELRARIARLLRN